MLALLRPRIEGGAVVDKQFSSSCGCDTEDPDHDPSDDGPYYAATKKDGGAGEEGEDGEEGEKDSASSRPDNVATIALDILAQTGVFRNGRLVGGSDIFVSNVREPLTPFTNALTMTGTREDTECAIDKIDERTNTCLDNKTLSAVESYVKSKGVEVSDKRDVIKKAKEVTECDGETCVLRNIFSFLKTKGLDADAVVRMTVPNLKVLGPKDNTRWLDNVNIDETLQAWAREFPDFYPYDFCMMDFAKRNGSLKRIPLSRVLSGAVVKLGYGHDPIERKCKRMACVLNTDVSTGPGKHWVCVFVDCSGPEVWTIEYFNSSGNNPTEEVTAWIESARRDLREYLKRHQMHRTIAVVNYNQRHQESKSECGVFCLFYIRMRLMGTPTEAFENKKISDDDMVAFRKHLFSRVSLP